MIEGLYEAHLPVKNLEKSIQFYKKLGLELVWQNNGSVFFWIEKGKSWLGLWEGGQYKIEYHPSLRHIAFRVSYQNLKESLSWLESLDIKPVPFDSRKSVEPFIRPYQSNGSVYFKDPDGNSLELMCYVDVPDGLKHIKEKLWIGEWEELLSQYSL